MCHGINEKRETTHDGKNRTTEPILGILEVDTNKQLELKRKIK